MRSKRINESILPSFKWFENRQAAQTMAQAEHATDEAMT